MKLLFSRSEVSILILALKCVVITTFHSLCTHFCSLKSLFKSF